MTIIVNVLRGTGIKNLSVFIYLRSYQFCADSGQLRFVEIRRFKEEFIICFLKIMICSSKKLMNSSLMKWRPSSLGECWFKKKKIRLTVNLIQVQQDTVSAWLSISFMSSYSSCWGSSDSRSCWRVGWGWHSRKTHRHSWSLGSHTQWRGCSLCEWSAGQTGAETTVRRTLV